MSYKRKEEGQKEKLKIAKGKEMTSIAGRYATGNAHQIATRKKRKGREIILPKEGKRQKENNSEEGKGNK